VVDKLRQFLKTAYQREWIKDALHLKVTVVKCATKMKSPYEEDEVMRILAGVLNVKHTKYAQFPRTTRLLLEVMLETGMRVGDACRFDPRVLVKGERSQIYTFEPQKQKKNVTLLKSVDVFISQSLWQAIMQAKADGEWYSENLPFAFPHSKDEYYSGHVAYEMMQYVGDISGVEDCRPHRLRDTCAVALLEGSNRACTRSGPKPPVSIDNVSKLLGHNSVRVTERYYSKWTKGRSRNLELAVA
jgi:integrase